MMEQKKSKRWPRKLSLVGSASFQRVFGVVGSSSSSSLGQKSRNHDAVVEDNSNSQNHKSNHQRRRRSRRSGGGDAAACSVSNNLPGIFADAVLTELPLVIWMDCIFPFLNRSGQNALAEAHREVAASRRPDRSSPNKQHYSYRYTVMDWPCGRIAKKLSRPVKSVVFSPSNTHNAALLVTYCKNKVLQYDKLSGPTASSLKPIKGHNGIVADVRFSPCGNILATASKNDGTVRLWRVCDDRNINEKNDDKDDNEDINNNNNGNSASGYECFRVLRVHQHDLRHIAWSPRGDKIVSWGQDGFLRVSDIRDGAMQSRFWKTRLEVQACHRSVAFDPTGSCVAFSLNNDCVYLWDLPSDSTRVLPEIRDYNGSYAGEFVTSLAYSPNGHFLMVGCHVATIRCWRVHVVALPSGTSEGDEEDYNGTNQLQQQQQNFRVEYIFDKDIFLGHGWSAVTLLTFTQDGRYLACANNGSQIRIVDTVTSEIRTTLEGHTGRIESLCFTSDSKTLASGSCDRTVRLWDTSSFCCRVAT